MIRGKQAASLPELKTRLPLFKSLTASSAFGYTFALLLIDSSVPLPSAGEGTESSDELGAEGLVRGGAMSPLTGLKAMGEECPTRAEADSLSSR